MKKLSTKEHKLYDSIYTDVPQKGKTKLWCLNVLVVKLSRKVKKWFKNLYLGDKEGRRVAGGGGYGVCNVLLPYVMISWCALKHWAV